MQLLYQPLMDTHSVGEIIQFLREQFPNLNLIAGNVTSGEGVEYLAKQVQMRLK